ncbi:MAG: hypothetical protein LBK47_03590 [Prevotellaceae bacterium]|nr:hypothetical protein [Prevotellaceae bacterium]
MSILNRQYQIILLSYLEPNLYITLLKNFRKDLVQGIPYMVLSDKEDKIMAKGNPNQGIKAKVDEVLAIENR